MRRRAIAGLVVAGVVGGATIGVLSAVAVERPGEGRGGGGPEVAAKASFPGPLYGVLLGRNEIGADDKKRAGDPDGRGSASAVYDAESGRLCFGLTVKDIGQPVAAHIHKGTRGENGPVVVTLVPPSGGDPGASSGCVAAARDVARAITKNPRKYYWNVHNSDYPGGAVRGQVFKRTR